MSAPSVLLVEDSTPDALIAKSALRGMGNGAIEHCHTLNAAIDRLRDPERQVPIAVLLDLTLPDSAGIDTFDRLASIGPPPVIVLTGDDDGELAIALIERGAQDYLVKGQFPPAALARAVRQAVERGRQRRQEREANERAEAALRAQSAFVAAMSHEIRTPLAAILGMADLLASTRLDLDQREFVEIARRCGRSLKALLDNVLEISRLESGRVELERAPFRFDTLAEECLEVFANDAHRKGISLVADLSGDVVGTAVGDAGRLRQVLFNLIGNAVKFTASGRVVLRARAGAGRGLVIEVEDTGIGIAPERRSAVFERFVQAESGTARTFGGSGLGLALCRDLVSAMGGSLELDSASGEGSVFRCELPLDVEPPAPTRRLAGRRVLALLADRVEREVCAARLRRSGARVVEVSRMVEAEARLEIERFDTVLADVRLDEGSAPALFEHLAAAGDAPHCVALLPVNHRAGDVADLRRLGAVALLKPAGWEALESAVEGATAAAPRAVPAPSFAGRRVLLVEDAREMRVLAQSYLRATGCVVEEALDGDEALEKARARRFDVILMDSHMPRTSGCEAARRIRAEERAAGRSAAPIIAVTADSMPEQKAALIAAGCDEHLAKPFTRADLFAALAPFLE